MSTGFALDATPWSRYRRCRSVHPQKRGCSRRSYRQQAFRDRESWALGLDWPRFIALTPSMPLWPGKRFDGLSNWSFGHAGATIPA